jgi:putative spermidine/putrescine transport system ATP-binding protein
VSGGSVDVRGIRLPLIARDTPDGPAVALVRPEAVSLTLAAEGSNGPLSGTVIAVSFLGAVSRLTVDMGDTTLVVQVPTAEATAHPGGTRVRIALRQDPVLITRDNGRGRL